ncbi:MAG TPA: ABC transporter ATP-binding protein [Aigarchaeota archaeon]|nr:ABC transporter ATP-binding protein [Aigarchaeota archaeon]
MDKRMGRGVSCLACVLMSLKLENIHKFFGHITALKNVNLEVNKGELLVILGTSGSGKSTLLRIISGLEKPDKGRVLINGRDVTYEPPYNRPTSMVFQDLALFPHLNVFENIAFGLKIRKYDRREVEIRVKEVAEMLRINDLLDRSVAKISGGQRQRVALARSLVLHPDILLLDEPLGALDMKLRMDMWVELKKLQRQVANTWVFVTHDQHEAMALADKIAVINTGEIQQLGTKDEVYDSPASLFVASFIGEMNFLEGRVTEVKGDVLKVETPVGEVEATMQRVKGRPETGARVTVGIRPEKIQITKTPNDCINTLSARVSEINFSGVLTTYELELPDGSRIKIQTTSRQIGYRQGDKVYISWSPEDVNVYVTQ